MLDLVGNPEDRFSHNEAPMKKQNITLGRKVCPKLVKLRLQNLVAHPRISRKCMLTENTLSKRLKGF